MKISEIESANFMNNQNYIVPRNIFLHKTGKELRKFFYALFIVFCFFGILYLMSFAGDFMFVYGILFIIFLPTIFLPIISKKGRKIEKSTIFYFFKENGKIYGKKK